MKLFFMMIENEEKDLNPVIVIIFSIFYVVLAIIYFIIID